LKKDKNSLQKIMKFWTFFELLVDFDFCWNLLIRSQVRYPITPADLSSTSE